MAAHSEQQLFSRQSISSWIGEKKNVKNNVNCESSVLFRKSIYLMKSFLELPLKSLRGFRVVINVSLQHRVRACHSEGTGSEIFPFLPATVVICSCAGSVESHSYVVRRTPVILRAAHRPEDSFICEANQKVGIVALLQPLWPVEEHFGC